MRVPNQLERGLMALEVKLGREPLAYEPSNTTARALRLVRVLDTQALPQ